MDEGLCAPCAGHGVVRRDGRPYRTVEAAAAADYAYTARDCEACQGSGLVGGWPWLRGTEWEVAR